MNKHILNPLSPWSFFALTFGWTWFFWLTAVLTGQNITASLVKLLFALGGIGPAVSAIIHIYSQGNREVRRDYWQRVIDFKRIGAGWYLVILLTIPVLTALAVLLDMLLGGNGAQPDAIAGFISQPLRILPFIIFILFFGPLPEELGWRAYVLDRLQIKWNALTASVVLGIFWALWHLPIFFIKGTFQHNLGIGSVNFWRYMLGMIPVSILMTWIYNNNKRSTLSAILFHFMINFSASLFKLAQRAELFTFIWTFTAAITVTIIWGHKTLTHQQKSFNHIKQEHINE